MRDRLGTLVTGLLLGFSLSRIGFSSWDEVHRMFTFADLRLFLTFLFGVGVLGALWRIVLRLSRTAPDWPERRVHRGSVVGGLVFGAGWALCGACPGIAFVQIGEGQLAALLTLGGMFVGNWLYSHVHERYFQWSVQSCADN